MVVEGAAPATVDGRLPVEGWQRLLGWFAGWAVRHEQLVSRLLVVRVVLAWVLLVGCLVAVVVYPPVREVLVVPLSGVAMLATLCVLARTRTASRTTIGVWYSGCLVWAVVIGWVTTVTSAHLVGVFPTSTLFPALGVGSAGASTAVAAFGEESLKLLPLLVLGVAAPGRVRRLSRADWLILGYAVGLAFMVVEESVRALVFAVDPTGFDVAFRLLSGQDAPGFSWWPFAGRGFEVQGEVSARYAGHHILTGLVAGCVGLGVWWWRSGGRGRRVAAVVVPVAAWWVAVVDHFGFNATTWTPRWLGDPDSSVPGVLQWSFRLTGHGGGRTWLAVAVFVAVLLLDASVLRPDGARTRSGAGAVRYLTGGLVALVGALVERSRGELSAVLAGYQPRPGEQRGLAVRRGRQACHGVLGDRAGRFARCTEVAQLVRDGEPAVVATRRLVRGASLVAAVLLVVAAVVVGAWVASRVGLFVLDPGGWLAGLLERLAQWWGGLPGWGKALVFAAVVAVVVVGTVATGGALLAGIASGLSVAGMGLYTVEHGRGLAALLRDPRGATTTYLRERSPGMMVWDVAELGLTFVPAGAVAGLAGRSGVRVAARGADGLGAGVPLLDDAGRLGDDAVGLTDDAVDGAAGGRGPGWGPMDGVPAGRGAAPLDGPAPRVGEPVDVVTGAVVAVAVDATYPGVLELELTRGHVSTVQAGGSFGAAWCSLLDERLEWTADTARLVTASAAVQVVDLSSADEHGWSHTAAGRAVAVRRDGEHDWTAHEAVTGTTWRFAAAPSSAGSAGSAGVAALVAVVDRHGNRVDLERDAAGLVRTVRHSGGYRVEVQWRAVSVEGTSGRAPRVAGYRLVTPSGPVVLRTFGYDPAGQLEAVADPAGHDTRYGYDPAGRLVWTVDSNGTRYEYGYDAQGRCVRGQGSGGTLDVDIVYDGPVRRVADSTGALTEYEVNSAGQVVKVRDPLGRITTARWDAFDRPLLATDATGAQRRFTYSPAGDLVESLDEAGRATRVEWAGPGRPAAVHGPDGATWRYLYDERGQMAQVVDPGGGVTSLTHNDRGALVAVGDPMGVLTRYQVDAAGLPVAVSDASGALTRFERDAFGRVTGVVDAAGGRTRREYSAAGRLVRQVDPDGGVQQWDWDGEGNLHRHVDAAGRVTSWQYTPFDAPRVRIDPDGARTEVRYDTEQRVVAVLDPLGRSWSYVRDSAGQVVGESDVNGRTVTYSLDDAGRVAERVNASGQHLRYHYDPTGLLLAIRGDGVSTEYRYDGAGRLVGTMSPGSPGSPGVDHVVERDRVGRVVAESWNGLRVVHDLDRAGRRRRRVTPSGVESVWTYDRRGLPAAVDVAGHRVDLERDPLGREVTRRVGAGVRLERSWTASSRLASQRVLVGDGVAAERSHEYSLAGDLLGCWTRSGRSGPGVTEQFALDPMGRVLARVVEGREVERYRYDPAGSVVSSGDSWGRSGTVVRRVGMRGYHHDRDGRLVTRRTIRPSLSAAVERFRYDAADRLVAVTLPDATVWEYHYDGLGRRVRRVHTDPAGTVLAQESVLWDGDLVAEVSGVQAVSSTAGGWSLTWDHDPVTGHPLSQVAGRAAATGDGSPEDTDRRFWAIVSDLVGAPQQLVTPSGRVAWSRPATIWGARTRSEPDTEPASESLWDDRDVDCPLGFAGQTIDAETGLAYNRHRYYDPGAAGYITPDPLGAAPGPNPHTYVPNPTTWTDPLGLTGCANTGSITSSTPRFITTGGGTTIDRAAVGTTISTQRQGRHVLGARQYSGGSYFNSANDAQQVLDQFHSGAAEVLGLKGSDVVVRVRSVTGVNVNLRAGFPNQPTDIFFIKGTRSPSVVPYNPGWTP